MEIGIVQKVDIDEEMQQSYLDYAMSVIVARALPDARDGLKPVHRRILYAMYDMGLRPDTPYKKSARIVGEVLGKYHPHGDMAVYEAMARMAQEFSMRYALVDGQGNFGSVDGDSPAAMRYTEARLHKLSMNLLADIQKDTVTFDDNFDGTLQEPGVLPAAFPNLLVNGATGIAVGMSTSIPPHNLGEVVDAIRYMLDNWEKLDDIDLEHLMRFIQGPDFPTGAIIIQEASDDGLTSAYGTGRGRVTLQARAHLEEMDRGRSRIIVTELPYMTNKASLIERIATLVREERLEGVADLRDESDRHGMRIVIELSRGIDPEKVLRDLYRSTPMQSTFSIILLALVDGEPRLLNLKQALKVYVEHRLEIVRRRSQHDLEKARQRAHILEGYRVALKNLDEVISLIRKAPDAETARDRLMKRFKLSQIQAQAILDLQLRRLAALERKKIDEEYKEVQALIKDLESLLRSPRKMRAVVGDELQAVRETYGDGRRTQIVRLQDGEKKVSLLTASDLTPQKNTWITVDASGLISRSQTEQLPAFDEAAAPLRLVQADSRDTLYLVTEHGEAAAIAVHNLPETASPSQGIPFHKVSPLSANDRLAALFSLPRDERTEDRFVLTVSRQGMVKKSALSELPGPSSGTFNLARVNEGDRLGWARISSGQDEVLLVTARGFSIRFKEEEVRPMGLVAAGVLGIKLQAGDEIAGAELLPQPGEILAVASDGTAKRTAPDQFPQQGRYGQGVILWKLDKDARVVGVAAGPGKMRVILHLQKAPPKSIRMQDVSLVGRAARGQAIKGIKSGLPVTAITAPQVRISPNGGAEELPDEGGAPPAGGVDGKAKRSRVKPSGPEANGKVGKAAGRGAGPAPKAKSTKGSAKPGKKPASRTSLRGSAATEAIPSDSSKDEIASQKPLAMTDDAMTDAKKATPKARSTKASSKKADPSTSLRMPDEKPATDAKKATPKAKSTKASSKKDPSTSLRMPEEKPDAAAKKAAPKGKTTRVSAKSKAGEATEAAAPKKKSAGVKEEGARRAPQPAAKKPATRGKKAAESEAAPAKTSKRSSTRAAPSPTAEEKPKATGRKKPTQPKLI